ncbi:hypothetical protein GCM10010392_69080 [Streptomyces clavifer]|nr:hypothetical protein GCM10010392_69080 [Streptomyces clavifer]
MHDTCTNEIDPEKPSRDLGMSPYIGEYLIITYTKMKCPTPSFSYEQICCFQYP